MEDKELLKLIDVNLRKHYKKKSRFDFLQYFSLTDMKPDELRKFASKNGEKALARLLLDYGDNNFWNFKKLDLEQHLRCLHSINGHALTETEKRMVAQKLQEEGFPLLEGTMIDGSRYYMTKGIDAISKEQIRENLIIENNSEHRKSTQQEQKAPRVLVKTR